MIETTERRHIARLFVPRHLGAVELKFREVHLLDLSPAGARMEHPDPVREGAVCFVDLPPALGKVWLTGRVEWTRLYKGKQTVEGETRVHYQSGLAFVGITPEQRTALAAALEILKTGE
jgi:hypothetical protein